MRVSSCLVLFCVLGVATPAQDEWSWPEKPKNIQVLPKDWPGSRLRAPMTGFTRALGVRCSHCHVGVEGEPLSTYDFASDENPNKNRAREMLRMLGSVNDHLDKIEPSGEPVNMWCHTCHRGRPRPMTLGEELGQAYRTKGADAVVPHYTYLRAEFYGKGAYHFDESALNAIGYEVLGDDDVAGALEIFELNSRTYPDSANVWDSLAEAYLKSGDTKLAKRYYRKSLKLNPENRNARDQLEALGK